MSSHVADDEAIPAYAGSGEAHAVRKLERRMRFFAAIAAHILGDER